MRSKKITLALSAISLTALAIFFLAAGSFAAPVTAAEATYDMSEEYIGSKYYENFINTPLTGDQASDVIAIALSQLGYHEGNSEDEMDGMSPDGKEDYVEYNRLYGAVYDYDTDDYNYGYYWCASFANWCLRQSGVTEEQSGGDSFISCWKWRKACIEAEIYHEKEGYVPKLGDIIFFIDVNDKTIQVPTSHVGLVIYCDGEKVYTVEGNTSANRDFESAGDNVATKSYPLDSEYIVGYATPKYNENPKVTRVDHNNYNEKTASGFYISEKNIKIFSDEKLTKNVHELESHKVFKILNVSGGVCYLQYTADGIEKYGYASANNGAIQTVSTPYSIIYKTAGGDVIYETKTFFGDRFTPPETTYPEGFEFIGWKNGDVNGTVSQDVTFVADIKDTRNLGFITDLVNDTSGRVMLIAAASCVATAILVGIVSAFVSLRSKKRKND